MIAFYGAVRLVTTNLYRIYGHRKTRDFSYSFGRNVSFCIEKTFARGIFEILKIDKVIKIHLDFAYFYI